MARRKKRRTLSHARPRARSGASERARTPSPRADRARPPRNRRLPCGRPVPRLGRRPGRRVDRRRAGRPARLRRYVLPISLTAIGGLMVGRSALVDLRPFRTGVAVASTGLLLVLEEDWGGYVGQGLEAVARLLGETGARSSARRPSCSASCSSRAPRSARCCGIRGQLSAGRVPSHAVRSTARSGRCGGRAPYLPPAGPEPRRAARPAGGTRFPSSPTSSRRRLAARPQPGRRTVAGAAVRARAGGRERLPSRPLAPRTSPSTGAAQARAAPRWPKLWYRRSPTSASTRPSSARSPARASPATS